MSRTKIVAGNWKMNLDPRLEMAEAAICRRLISSPGCNRPDVSEW
jgi:triosephosphate isomerase